MIREVKDPRDQVEEHALMLEDMAKRVRTGGKVVMGTFVQIFFQEGSVARSRHMDPGFNLLHAVGGYELLKAELADEIRGK